MIFSLPLFAQELELIDPDEWLPGKVDTSEDVKGVLGLEFGMTRDEVIAAMTGQGCTLAFEHTYSEHNLVSIGFDGCTYEEIPNIRVEVNLLADRDLLYFVAFTLYYGEEVTREKVLRINEDNVRKFGLTLSNQQEIEREGLFGKTFTNKLSEYYIMRADETGRILYGSFLYQVEEMANGCTFCFWGFPD